MNNEHCSLLIVHCSLLSAGVCGEKELALFCNFFFGARRGRTAGRRQAERSATGMAEGWIKWRNLAFFAQRRQAPGRR
jgi:hypothetical protein